MVLFRPSGNWNADTNTPTLANNEPTNAGKVYYVTDVGTQFGLTFAIGDKLAFIEGGVATKWDNVDDVTSVNGDVGAVQLNADDIPFNGSGTNYLTAKTEVESAIKELDTRVKANADNIPSQAVESVNGKVGPVVLDAEDIGALPDDTPLFSGDYDDLSNKPTIDQLLGNLSTLGFVKRTGTNTYVIDTSSYQPLDADLSSIAGLSGTSGLLKKTASNTWQLDTSVYLTEITKLMVEAVLTGTITTHTHNASDIVEDASHRFVTDVEKAYWDDKQDELIAGDNITIVGNTISASGGGGGGGQPFLQQDIDSGTETINCNDIPYGKLILTVANDGSGPTININNISASKIDEIIINCSNNDFENSTTISINLNDLTMYDSKFEKLNANSENFPTASSGVYTINVTSGGTKNIYLKIMNAYSMGEPLGKMLYHIS